MAAYTINDALLKLTAGDVPLMQLLFLRGVLATGLIYLLARHWGALEGATSRADRGLILMRSLTEIGAAYFFLTALFNMPLANVTAILQVLPLTVTMGVALFFKEHVGWRRWLAIGIGFGGMLLIVQPGTEGFTSWSIYALVAVGFVTARDLFTRRMSQNVSSLRVTLAGSLAVTLFAGLASVGQGWAPVSTANAIYLVASAGFILCGYLFSVMVMRVGDFSFIAPFRYTSLIWALILGWFVFGDWPAPSILAGAAIIVATGLFTLYREARARRKNIAHPV